MLDSRLVKLAHTIEKRPDNRLALGVDALDDAVGGGIPRSAVTEILSRPGHGGWWLAMRALARSPGRLGLLDHDGSFHPPGAAALGVDLSRLLVVRPQSRKDALWSLERLASSPALSATICWLDKLRDIELRRLQLAAERSGQSLLLLRDADEAGRASWGALRLEVRGMPGDGRVRRLQVTPLRGRGGILPRAVRIEVENGTGAVRGASVVPHRALDAEPGRAHRA